MNYEIGYGFQKISCEYIIWSEHIIFCSYLVTNFETILIDLMKKYWIITTN